MDDIKLIKNQIKELEDFRSKIQKQQLDYPLDDESYDVLRENMIVPDGTFLVPIGLGTYSDYVEIDLNGKKYLLETTIEEV